MKKLIILFLIFSTSVKAQNLLTFNKRFVECEDKWVAFKMNKDSSYSFGFIYIDSQAGLTLNFEGSFKIKDDIFVPEKFDSTNVIYRLEPNQVKVALIPPTRYGELKISPVPDWLKFYKTDTATIERLYRWGFLYNSWDECEKALVFLEKGQKINPKFKGLEFELGYAYNALEQFDKANSILKDAISSNPKDGYLYKELSYAQIHLGQLDEAEKSCKKGISLCSDENIKAEIAFNLTCQYYKIKDKEKFKQWAKETRKWVKKGDHFSDNIDKMEGQLK